MHRHIYAFLAAVVLLVLFAACSNATNNTTSDGSPNSTATKSANSTGGNTATVQATRTSANGCPIPGNGEQVYTIDSKQSNASYEVQEQFLSQNLPNQAIGKTNSSSGGFLVRLNDSPAITALKITVDLKSLTSDSSRRDDAIRSQWLESNTYPDATFVVKQEQAIPSNYGNGQTISFKLTGDMTMHGKTHSETFNMQGKKVGNVITGNGKSLVYMKDFGFDAPSIAGFLTVKDGATVTFNFTANQGGCPKLS
jgi:polyisoprenoid-binding protein YceI